MPPCAIPMPIAKLDKQGFKLFGVTVDVTDDVVVHLTELWRAADRNDPLNYLARTAAWVVGTVVGDLNFYTFHTP